MDNKATSSDAQDNKLYAILAYIIFFIPMLAAPNSAFGKYHANQGLLLLLFTIAVNVIGGIIPVIGWFLILPIGGLVSLVLFVMGVINAANGVMKPLPLIGRYTLLK